MTIISRRSVQNWFRVAVVTAIAVCSSAYGGQQNGLSQQAYAPVYVALGDSYPFGSRCGTDGCLAPDGTAIESNNDNVFVGYPAYLQEIIDRPLVNAGCPGETSTSFLTANTVEGPNCRAFKAAGLLHVNYAGLQIDFAESYLSTHDRVVLITLQLGGPETNRFLRQCNFDPACILAGFPAHKARLAANIGVVLARIRAAGYSGPIILVEYPTTDYNAFFAQLQPEITQAVLPFAWAYGAEVAPVFDGFKLAAQPYGGDSCAAGLLITAPDGTCNIHPTAAGHQLIASVIAEMVPPR